MVPDGYHDFFVASAGVSGALIGLLFVAISVNPAGVSAATAAHVRARPAAALSAFLNSLVLSLVSLLPDSNVGIGIVVIAITSAAAMIGSIVYLLAEARTDGIRTIARTMLSLLIQLATYVIQVVSGYRLQHHPDRTTAVAIIAITTIVLFGTGIDRAWEFIGARKVNLIGSVAETIVGSGHPDGDRPGDQPGGQPAGAVPSPDSDARPRTGPDVGPDPDAGPDAPTPAERTQDDGVQRG